jgi:hypothetical protein
VAVEYVDVSDIHLRDINFQITRADGRVFDFSDVVTGFSWSDHVNTAGAEASIDCVGSVADILKIGGEGSSAEITAPLVDLDTGKLVRRELWRGTFEDVVDQRREGQIERNITAFDIAKFLAGTEEDYIFTNSSLSNILTRVCNDFSIPKGDIPSTGVSVGQVINRGGTLWDMLQEAVQRHVDLTGEVYYVYAMGGRINLRKQGDQSRYWVFEAGESLQTARRTRSVANLINQVKIYGVFEGETDKPVVVAVKKNDTSQGLYGLRQRIDYVPSAEDEAKVVTVAEKILDRYAAPDETLEITGWLVPNLRAGEKVRYVDTEWGLNRLYYVESIDTQWNLSRAETVATVRREAIDPELILAEVTSV